MTYRVSYHRAVVRDDIPVLDSAWKKRIHISIEQKLQTSPDLFGIPLRRSLKGYRKLRVGDYRIIFCIEKQQVIVLAILHRSVVYQRLDSRIM